jgi:predicted dehydrogenase
MRVALCGYGSMGRHHAQMLKKHGADVELYAIADVQEERQNLILEDFPRMKVYSTGQELLANESLDAALVCVPTFLHAEMSVLALNKGCHVLCEKPMALNAEQCAEMISAAKQAGKVLLIGQVLRFWPEYQVLREAISSKTYGELRALSMTRVGGVSTGWKNWFLDEKRGGMQIFDRHIHDSDALLWLLGKPRAVQAFGFSRDPETEGGINHSFTHYDYGDGLVVSAEGSADMPKGFPFTAAYRANFDHACLEFNSRGNPTLTLYEDDKISHPLQQEAAEEVQSGLNISSAGPYFTEQAYFFDCIRQGIMPQAVTAAEAMQTIKLVRAEIESVRSGKPVEL